ncbi:MAG: class I SAM-dependent methyltransferase [Chloroflexota bacterium]
MPERYSFTRYLSAKKSIDSRALNHHVWQSLAQALPTSTPENPLQVLEVGSGIGTMLERILEQRLLTHTNYTAIDIQVENIVEARQQLQHWADSHNSRVTETAQGNLLLERTKQQVLVEFEAIDIFDFTTREQGRRKWDMLVAHAFLDLMDIPATLPRLFSLLRDGGLFYFTINFDGATILEPVIDPQLDELIPTLYHQTMDRRIVNGKVSGDSRAGRHLFIYLKNAGAHILDAGPSDWVVFAGTDGYAEDEASFLHFIINTIDLALKGHPQLDASRFTAWVAKRHAQVERGELVCIIHQLDFVGRYP